MVAEAKKSHEKEASSGSEKKTPFSGKITKLNTLKKDMSDINVEFTIDFVGKKNRGMAYGEEKYTPIIIKDDTAEINLTLFGDASDDLSPGMKLRVTKCYVSEYKGNLQLNTTKKSEVTVLERPKKKPSASSYFARMSKN